MLATSAMTGQATFSPEEDEEDEEEEDDDEDDLAGLLTVSADFFAAGASADAPPFELDSLDVEEEEAAESLDALSLVPASAATEAFFLLSVR
jgi:hypothetical protein